MIMGWEDSTHRHHLLENHKAVYQTTINKLRKSRFMNTITDVAMKVNGEEIRDTATESSNGLVVVSTPASSTTTGDMVTVACNMLTEVNTKVHGGTMPDLDVVSSPGKMEPANTRAISLMTKCTAKADSNGLVVLSIQDLGAITKRWGKVSCSTATRAHTKANGKMTSGTARV